MIRFPLKILLYFFVPQIIVSERRTGSKDDLIDFLIGHMPNTEGMTETERRNQYNGWLSQLKHWK